MVKDVSEHEIRKVIKQIKHSAIDRTLVELGIIKKFKINKDNVSVTLAFPFENIPIKDYLIMSVKVPLEKLHLIVEVKTTVMSKKETERFLVMEEKYWKTGKKADG